MKRLLFTVLLLAAPLAAPASALAADAIVVADLTARQPTALDGTLVWVSGNVGVERLMRRAPDGAVGPVPGAPVAVTYRDVDLGRDAAGRLVLTYGRCLRATAKTCAFIRDDLAGHRASFRGIASPSCELSTAPSMWREWIAYGQSCRRGRVADERRSGLYVKRRGRRARRVPIINRHFPFGLSFVDAVDVRGTRVAAFAVGGVAHVAVSMTLSGRDQRSFVASDPEGDTGQEARGPVLGARGALWALTNTEHLDDPVQSTIQRLRSNCLHWETLTGTAPGPSSYGQFAATDLAVDNETLYLIAPSVGIVRHDFTPKTPGQCRTPQAPS